MVNVESIVQHVLVVCWKFRVRSWILWFSDRLILLLRQEVEDGASQHLLSVEPVPLELLCGIFQWLKHKTLNVENTKIFRQTSNLHDCLWSDGVWWEDRAVPWLVHLDGTSSQSLYFCLDASRGAQPKAPGSRGEEDLHQIVRRQVAQALESRTPLLVLHRH